MYPMILSVRKSMSLVTIIRALHLHYTATYDVQSLAVEEGGGGGVMVRGEFLSGSRADRCLVVFQGPHTSPDIFRVLHRTQSQDSVSTSVHLPPSTYTLYGYDVEENGLPNTMPAVVLEMEISNDIEGQQLAVYVVRILLRMYNRS